MALYSLQKAKIFVVLTVHVPQGYSDHFSSPAARRLYCFRWRGFLSAWLRRVGWGHPLVRYQKCEVHQRQRQWHPTPVLLPGKSHGQRSLIGCSPWGRQESDMTERLPFHFSLSCTGGGNGNPLQCSCLENPSVGGAWWAAIYGVTQSWTRLKRLSSSSSTVCLQGNTNGRLRLEGWAQAKL